MTEHSGSLRNHVNENNGTLWASGVDGMYRLDTTATGGYPGEWITLAQVPLNEQRADRILVLHPDTLVVQYTWAWRSINGGRTFDLVAGSDSSAYNGLAEIPTGVPHAGRLLLGDEGGVQFVEHLYSDDRGATWAQSVLLDGTIRQSDDGGETWETVGHHLRDAVVGPDGRLYVAVSKSGCCDFQWVFRTAEAVPVAAEPGPERLRLEVNPNPARGAAEVAFTLAQPSEVTAAVHDVLGREVVAPASGHYGAGRHTLTVGSELPAGSYVVRVDVGEVAAVGRLTVVR